MRVNRRGSDLGESLRGTGSGRRTDFVIGLLAGTPSPPSAEEIAPTNLCQANQHPNQEATVLSQKKAKTNIAKRVTDSGVTFSEPLRLHMGRLSSLTSVLGAAIVVLALLLGFSFSVWYLSIQHRIAHCQGKPRTSKHRVLLHLLLRYCHLHARGDANRLAPSLRQSSASGRRVRLDEGS